MSVFKSMSCVAVAWQSGHWAWYGAETGLGLRAVTVGFNGPLPSCLSLWPPLGEALMCPGWVCVRRRRWGVRCSVVFLRPVSKKGVCRFAPPSPLDKPRELKLSRLLGWGGGECPENNGCDTVNVAVSLKRLTQPALNSKRGVGRESHRGQAVWAVQLFRLARTLTPYPRTDSTQ